MTRAQIDSKIENLEWRIDRMLSYRQTSETSEALRHLNNQLADAIAQKESHPKPRRIGFEIGDHTGQF